MISHINIVSSVLPWPLHDRVAIDTYHTIDTLHREGYQVHLFVLSNDAQKSIVELDHICKISFHHCF